MWVLTAVASNQRLHGSRRYPTRFPNGKLPSLFLPHLASLLPAILSPCGGVTDGGSHDTRHAVARCQEGSLRGTFSGVRRWMPHWGPPKKGVV